VRLRSAASSVYTLPIGPNCPLVRMDEAGARTVRCGTDKPCSQCMGVSGDIRFTGRRASSGRLLLVFPDDRFLTDHLYNRYPVMLRPYAAHATALALIELQGHPIHE